MKLLSSVMIWFALFFSIAHLFNAVFFCCSSIATFDEFQTISILIIAQNDFVFHQTNKLAIKTIAGLQEVWFCGINKHQFWKWCMTFDCVNASLFGISFINLSVESTESNRQQIKKATTTTNMAQHILWRLQRNYFNNFNIYENGILCLVVLACQKLLAESVHIKIAENAMCVCVCGRMEIVWWCNEKNNTHTHTVNTKQPHSFWFYLNKMHLGRGARLARRIG